MGDVGEMYNAMYKDSKKRRASHRENSPVLLENAGIPFVVKNHGAHLIVEGKNCFIDFWPGTGKWIIRKGGRGFGVKNLIKLINGDR